MAGVAEASQIASGLLAGVAEVPRIAAGSYAGDAEASRIASRLIAGVAEVLRVASRFGGGAGAGARRKSAGANQARRARSIRRNTPAAGTTGTALQHCRNWGRRSSFRYIYIYIYIQLSPVALITEPMLNCGEGWLRTPQASFSTCPGIFSDVPRHLFRRAQASISKPPGVPRGFVNTAPRCCLR